MIVVPLPYGRLCNRLALAASFIAFSEEFGTTFVHLAFADYCRFFEKTRFAPFLVFRPKCRTKKTKKGVSVLSIFKSHDAVNQCFMMDDPSTGFIRLATTKRVVFALGWLFRTDTLTQKHHAVIRQFFMPRRSHRMRAEKILVNARQNVDHVVGIHMRQTDYKTFAQGKYFFSPETYRKIMGKIASRLPGKTAFLVCSDAPIPFDQFPGLLVIPGPGHPIEDNYALASCDYIAGPPSTFSHWASYFGKVPLYFIETENAEPELDAFTIRFSV
jgi:hypothetical protein